MIGNKASEFSNGLMAGDMKACGIMASNMDKALIYLTMGSEGRGSGKKAEGVKWNNSIGDDDVDYPED
eukprot:CAMPEP_0201281926 /NCGR_PEP_ID=MMETSP1317-20130820/4415_1 /ASSEMBLY_ACC=CAM_ASM_000770 /TAXON_ID=187299 /ORGANISM="Undescribed Undescribed, Strain Undescribed" /LENGTH=67 /DNA_ID=CAMNT_0047593223 /DNA_START=153 /DNA_END=355 /DNA_ORIENTATION=-